jgi:hypothetical protein
MKPDESTLAKSLAQFFCKKRLWKHEGFSHCPLQCWYASWNFPRPQKLTDQWKNSTAVTRAAVLFWLGVRNLPLA